LGSISKLAKVARVNAGELGRIAKEHGRRRRLWLIVRPLILLGQSREEVAAMRWSELDLDKRLWRLDGERTKNALPHDVPLPDVAIDLLTAQARRAGRR
jgi:integrase